MLPTEILKKIRRLEIRTSKLVNETLAGEYHSVFRGQGMEFDEVREYQPGDDIRNIDWNVTSRAGRPFIKKFMEERELTVILVVDASASGDFGSALQTKRERAAEISAVLAFAAVRNNDRVGLIIFTDKVEKYVPPRKGRRHVLRVIREVLWTKPEGRGTDIRQSLEFLLKVLKRRSVVFVISDFLAPDFSKPLLSAQNRHDVIAVAMDDTRERELPNIGLVRLADPETGEEIVVDTGDRRYRQRFSETARAERARRDEILKRSRVDVLRIDADQPYEKALVEFFMVREKRLKRESGF